MGDQSLHYVDAGDGPLIVLLHGFPGSVRLAATDRAARGGRFSGRPRHAWLQPVVEARGLRVLGVDLLADDIRGLIEERGAKSALLVGHDWGGSIAWTVATKSPRGG